MNIVTTLNQRKGHYSEIFLNISGVGSGRMALYPSPVEYWMATTDEKDQAVLYNYIGEGYSLDKAIQDLAKRYPHGIAG